jgi:excisionase family DNA binding protein
MTTLRQAVVWATRQETWWSAEEIAAISALDLHGVKVYLSRLSKERVLERRGDGFFKAGPQAETWRKTEPKTKPGGNNMANKLARDVKSGICTRAWMEMRARGQGDGQEDEAAGLTSPSRTMADNGGQWRTETQEQEAVAMRQQLLDVSVSQEMAAEHLMVSTRTMRRWARQGVIKAVTLSRRSVRVPLSEVRRLLAEGVPQVTKEAQA